MPEKREVSLFRNGRNQAIRIPVEFELQGKRALISRDGDTLLIEPVKRKDLMALLSTLDPIEEDFAPFDEGLQPLRDDDIACLCG